MGYIGNQSNNAYSSLPVKQDLTGATGTSLTLTHSVASAEGIDLYINNVRQEPTEAYSVVGTAVTLTGSVVATDDIYVVYNSLALQTTVPPDASVSTAKIIDGDVTSAKLDTNIAIAGDLTVDTDTLHVDSTNNRVGIGTSSPASTLNIVDTASTANVRLESGSGTPVILQNFASASAGGAYIDVNSNHPLLFRTNATERMRLTDGGSLRINAIGNVIGSGEMLSVSTGSGQGGVAFAGANTSGLMRLWVQKTGGGNAVQFFSQSGGSFVGSINLTASTTAYNTTSDYRLKTAVNYDWDATTRLKQLKPARFEWIAEGDDAVPVDGFLAHEVQTVVPEAITGTHDEVDDDGNPEYQGIDQSKLVPLLVKTIQELEARITALEAS